MKYFLRFTDTASEDLSRGTSLLDLPSLDKPIVLEGLCGYSFAEVEEIECGIITEDEIRSKLNMYKKNIHYAGKAVLFLGNYIKNNPNSEGVIFEPIEIYEEY